MRSPTVHFKFTRNGTSITPCGAKVNDKCVSTESLVTCQKCKRVLNGHRLSRMKYKGIL